MLFEFLLFVCLLCFHGLTVWWYCLIVMEIRPGGFWVLNYMTWNKPLTFWGRSAYFLKNIFYYFFSSFLAAWRHMDFPGQGPGLSGSCEPKPKLRQPRILNPLCWVGIELVSQRFQDATDPIVPQWKIPFFFFFFFFYQIFFWLPAFCTGDKSN